MFAKNHYRLIAILHLLHGFVAAATAIGVFLWVVFLFGFQAMLERWIFPVNSSTDTNLELWVGVFAILVVAVCMIAGLLFTVPALAGGYGLLQRKRWARKLVLVSAVMAAFDFPFGTALAVYTFWFLFGQEGRNILQQGDSY
jgi:hypothetical protein